MKRIWIYLLLLCCCLGRGNAQTSLAQFPTSIVANSNGFNLINSPSVFHQITWRGTGTLSTCTVALDSSPDGVTWTAGGVIAGQTCTTNGSSTVVNLVVNYVRINVTAISGGGTITVVYTGFSTNPAGGGSGTVNTGTTPDGAYYATSTAAVSDGGTAVVTYGAIKAANAVVASTPLFYTVGALCGAGCTGTTTFPVFFHQPTGTTAYTGWSNGANNGTVFGANEASGFTGNFMAVAIAGVSKFFIDSNGNLNGAELINLASANNSRFRALSTGDVAYTNTAGNVALQVLNAQAAPTVDLLDVAFGAGPTLVDHVDKNGNWFVLTQNTNTNCSSSASPAVCAAAPSGSVAVAAASTTLTVNTTVVTANSQILLTFDSSLGTRLGVTCNTTITQPTVSTRTAATSFVITMSAAPVTNPACISYTIIN